MRFRSSVFCAGLLLWLTVPAVANTANFGFSVSGLGGNLYRYDYSITNTGSLGAGVPIILFDVFFDTSLYQESSLAIVTPDPPASQWSETLLTSLPSVPSAYDGLALGAGILDGGTVSGFAVRFTFLGQGTPGPQPYRIYDPNNFRILESGTTGSPEPSFFGVMALVLAAGAWQIRRKRLQHTRTP